MSSLDASASGALNSSRRKFVSLFMRDNGHVATSKKGYLVFETKATINDNFRRRKPFFVTLRTWVIQAQKAGSCGLHDKEPEMEFKIWKGYVLALLCKEAVFLVALLTTSQPFLDNLHPLCFLFLPNYCSSAQTWNKDNIIALTFFSNRKKKTCQGLTSQALSEFFE